MRSIRSGLGVFLFLAGGIEQVFGVPGEGVRARKWGLAKPRFTRAGVIPGVPPGVTKAERTEGGGAEAWQSICRGVARRAGVEGSACPALMPGDPCEEDQGGRRRRRLVACMRYRGRQRRTGILAPPSIGGGKPGRGCNSDPGGPFWAQACGGSWQEVEVW